MANLVAQYQDVTAQPIGRRVVLSAVTSLAAMALAPAVRAGQPLVFDHVWGRTVLPGPARRVVSLGYTSHDTLLALGVVPVALRYWYGGSESGVWPWAEPFLVGHPQPDILRGEVSMEKVAALRPDLIVAIGAGITQEEYSVLSRIAPTLVHEVAYTAYGTPWDVITRTLGRATGRDDLAAAQIDSVRNRFATVAARHPLWRGQGGVAAYHWAGTTGVFLPGDARADFLAELGFAVPPQVADLADGGGFFIDLSPEDLSPLDAGVLVWISALEADPDLAALPMRHTLVAWEQGREVFAGPLASAAMAHGSVLSMPFALDLLTADLSAAADGMAETPVPSAVSAGLAP